MTVPFDLSQLPALPVVEQVEPEHIISDLRDAVLALYPQAQAVIDLESEPLRKQIENFAMREALLREAFNARALSLTLAGATGAALDHIGTTYYFTPRLELVAADAAATPPVAQVLETDEAYRRRILLAWDAQSTAGATKSYEYHALSASGGVRDVSVTSPIPGTTLVTVLGAPTDGAGDGVPTEVTLQAVRDALNVESVRPLCEDVQVAAVQHVDYTLAVSLVLPAGAEQAPVRTAAIQALKNFVTGKHALGATVTVAGVYAAAMVPGMLNAGSDLPADLQTTALQAPRCTQLVVDGEVVAL